MIPAYSTPRLPFTPLQAGIESCVSADLPPASPVRSLKLSRQCSVM
jgi:hypothetical protein